MINKKGFTLVEVLAVVALLGLVMMLVIPNVLNPFKESKESLFLENVRTVHNSATTTYLMNVNVGQNFCHGQSRNGTLLNLSLNNLYYKVSVNFDGKVTSIIVTDGVYTYSDTKSEINKNDIKKTMITESNTSISC